MFMSLKDEPYHITIEIVNRNCKGLKMLRVLGVKKYALTDIRGLPGGLTRHLIKIPLDQINEINEGKFSKIRSSRKFGREASFDSDGCDVCNTIFTNNSFLISARHISDYTIVYNFVVPNFKAFKSIVSTLENSGLKPKILEVVRFKPKGKILTEKQERVLWLALKLGFFNYPRKVNTIELSRRLGIVPSTLSEITRRGIRRLLESHFKT